MYVRTHVYYIAHFIFNNENIVITYTTVIERYSIITAIGFQQSLLLELDTVPIVFFFYNAHTIIYYAYKCAVQRIELIVKLYNLIIRVCTICTAVVVHEFDWSCFISFFLFIGSFVLIFTSKVEWPQPCSHVFPHGDTTSKYRRTRVYHYVDDDDDKMRAHNLAVIGSEATKPRAIYRALVARRFRPTIARGVPRGRRLPFCRSIPNVVRPRQDETYRSALQIYVYKIRTYLYIV
jgi:hypothetical protein